MVPVGGIQSDYFIPRLYPERKAETTVDRSRQSASGHRRTSVRWSLWVSLITEAAYTQQLKQEDIPFRKNTKNGVCLQWEQAFSLWIPRSVGWSVGPLSFRIRSLFPFGCLFRGRRQGLRASDMYACPPGRDDEKNARRRRLFLRYFLLFYIHARNTFIKASRQGYSICQCCCMSSAASTIFPQLCAWLRERKCSTQMTRPGSKQHGLQANILGSKQVIQRTVCDRRQHGKIICPTSYNAEIEVVDRAVATCSSVLPS